MSEALTARAAARTGDVPAALAPGWWARGLNLAERCALAGPPVPAPAAGQRAARRLVRWKESYNLAESGQFDRRLAAAGLTEAELLALLAEDAASLAARAAEPPAWARFTEDVFAGVANDRAVPDLPDSDDAQTWLAGFRVIVAPFVTAAVPRFVAAASERSLGDLVDIGALRRGLAEQINQGLAALAARTLVLELNVLRVTGHLAGATPTDRYWEFVRHFASPAGLAALLEEYPVLARLLAQRAELTVEALLELLDRLAADRDASVAELFGGVDPGPLVKANGVEAQAQARWRALFDGYLAAMLHRGRFSAWVQSAQSAISTFAPLALFWFGIWLVLSGRMPRGATLAANSIAMSVLGPLQKFAGTSQMFAALRAQIERIYDVLDAPEEPSGTVRLSGDAPAGVVLWGPTFRYHAEAPPVLRDITLTLPPGGKLGIVGRTGSGKSTLALLMLGLLRTEHGLVAHDGVPLERLDLAAMRQDCGAVLQDLTLFDPGQGADPNEPPESEPMG